MKVLHVLNTNKFSGAENVVIQIISGFKNILVDEKFDFVYVSLDGAISKILKDRGVQFEPIKKLSFSEIKRVIEKYKPDIIHAHDFTASIVCSHFSHKVKVISHIHCNPPWLKKYGFKSILYRMSYKHYDKILGVSSAIFSEYIFGKTIRKKSLVVGNPINTKRIQELANDYGRPKKYDLIFIGRLSQEKNPFRFIDLINELKNQNQNIFAAILGDGNLRENVLEKIDSLKLQNNIEYLGFRTNPYEILSRAKILCITSSWEGFGLVAVEALSLAIPVVATPVGGLIDIIEQDSYGKLCVSNQEFINEILKLLTNNRYYESKQNAAKLRANELNNIDKYLKIIKNCYTNTDN